MTDTDIAALVARLRKVKAGTAREAADALEALQAGNDDIGRFTISVEKLLCEKLGKPWRASGISIATLVDELADRAEKAERHVEELQEKVDADTSCACSYDNPGDVCLSHSPALKAALARAEAAEAAIVKAKEGIV